MCYNYFGGDVMKNKKNSIRLLILLILLTISGCTTSKEDTDRNKQSLQQDTLLSLEASNVEESDLNLRNEISVPSILGTNTIEDNINSETFQLNLKENTLASYINQNSDFAGILFINDTSIDFPVLKGKDNDYYLKRDINKEKDKYGSIFMDYRNFGAGFDRNTIIYGHNMKDNKMFGELRNYMDYSFTLNNQIIEFRDLYSTRKYKIFSTYFSDSDGDLITTSFTDETFSNYINIITENSFHDYNLPLSIEDNILTLVTCSYEIDDGRYFIHAVEIKEQ